MRHKLLSLVLASKYEFAFPIDNASVSVSEHLTILEVNLHKLGKAYWMSGWQQHWEDLVTLSLSKQWTMKRHLCNGHFEYCAPLLLGIGKGQSKRMEDANFYICESERYLICPNRAIKIVMHHSVLRMTAEFSYH